jgi:tryptophanase
VYVDARRFAPHIPQPQFPAQALCAAIYLDGGVRTAEIGGVAFACQDPQTGEWTFPELELVRLTLPRRVYTQSHLDYVVRVLADLWQNRDQIRGLNIVFQTKFLRHFTARFELV